MSMCVHSRAYCLTVDAAVLDVQWHGVHAGTVAARPPEALPGSRKTRARAVAASAWLRAEEKDLWRMCLTTRDDVTELWGSAFAATSLRDPSMHGSTAMFPSAHDGVRRSTDAMPHMHTTSPHLFEPIGNTTSIRGNLLRDDRVRAVHACMRWCLILRLPQPTCYGPCPRRRTHVQNTSAVSGGAC